MHALCSYPSKLRPQIAHFFIKELSRPGDMIFDPFCGSGTVPLEARLLQRRATGVDLSPLAYILTFAKAKPPSLDVALRRIEELGNRIETREAPSFAPAPSSIQEYFHPKTLSELLIWRAYLLRLEEPCDYFLLACLAGILHGGRPGFLSRFTRDLIPFRPIGSAEHRPVAQRLKAKAKRALRDGTGPLIAEVDAHQADSRDLSFLPDGTVDLIVTSPPFFATTEFVRHNWLRTWLVGWELDQQRLAVDSFIGERAANLPRFETDLELVTSECKRLLKGGAYMVVHGSRAGNLDLVELMTGVGQRCGLTVEAEFDEAVDHTIRNRVRKISGETHRFLVLRKAEGAPASFLVPTIRR